jgi:hypothetical protein
MKEKLELNSRAAVFTQVERQFGAHWSWSGTGFGDRAGDTFIDAARQHLRHGLTKIH